MINNHYPGKLITFEGIDGCGKSTQAELLAEHLTKLGHNVVLTKEPGSNHSELCKDLRKTLFKKTEQESWTQASELFIFFADRAQHLAKVIVPALKVGKIVISDRYVDSTYAYQTIQGIDPRMIYSLDDFVKVIEPDITFLFYIDPALAFSRAKNARTTNNHYDGKPFEFFETLAIKYMDTLTFLPRVRMINGNTTIEKTFEEVINNVEESMIYWNISKT